MNGVILIDPGPDVAQSIARIGRDLGETKHWLITHGHHDHLDPVLLLSRSWAIGDQPLAIWGPPNAIDALAPWIPPESCIDLRPCTPGFTAAIAIDDARYRITAHRADHVGSAHHADAIAEEALLWSISHGDQQLLYATDTGPNPQVHPGPYDLVLLDSTFGEKTDHGTGHLDFDTMPTLLDEWRSTGILGNDSRVIATHIGHHNPPRAELVSMLQTIGVEVYDDGTELDTSCRSRGRRILVTGGTRSGKSQFAEELAKPHADVTYVATARRRNDEEWDERIAAHRERRSPSWDTLETLDLESVITRTPTNRVVLIDCIGLWLTHLLDDLNAWGRLHERKSVITQVHIRVDALRTAIMSSSASIICVTNEVGMSLIPTDAGSRLFTDLLGYTNAQLAQEMDETFLVVAGRPLRLPTQRATEKPL